MDRARREHPRLHGVVDSLERRHVHETGRVAQDHDTVTRAARGGRVVAALGDRLRTPLHHLAALQVLPEQRVQLDPLEQLVDVECGVVVIEPHHQSKRYQVRLEWVHEAATEGIGGDRPAERVDDRIERPLGLPDLFHAERVDLRILGRHGLPLEPPLRQASPRPLGQHRYLGGEIVGRHVIRERPPRAIQAGRRGPDARNAPPIQQQARGREAREDVHPQRRGSLAQPAHDLAQRRYVVPGVVHRGRRGKGERPARGEEGDPLLCDGPAEREVGIPEVGEQLAERAGVHDRAREAVLAQRFGLLEHADVHVRVLALGEAGQLDRAGETGRPRAHDEHVQLHPVARALGACRKDQPVDGQRRLVLRRNEPLTHGAS